MSCIHLLCRATQQAAREHSRTFASRVSAKKWRSKVCSSSFLTSISLTHTSSKMTSSRTISIALLVADTPAPSIVEKRGEYISIYSEWLQSSMAAIARHSWQEKIELQIRPFDVVKEREYPDRGQLKDGLWDAVIVTGSASSAFADLPWTNQLSDFIARLAKDHPLVRIIGICYGHQIIARAFGAKVELNEKGWELGVYNVGLTEDGKRFLSYEDHEKIMHIHQVHRDIVVSLPPPFQSEPFINLGYTSRCAIQGLALPYPTEAPPLPSAAGGSSFIAFDINAMDDTSGPSPARSLHVLTLQGHPEFDEEIVKLIIDARTEMGTIDGDLREQGLERAARAHDGRRLGAAVLTMLGVEPRRTESGTQGDGGVGV